MSLDKSLSPAPEFSLYSATAALSLTCTCAGKRLHCRGLVATPLSYSSPGGRPRRHDLDNNATVEGLSCNEKSFSKHEEVYTIPETRALREAVHAHPDEQYHGLPYAHNEYESTIAKQNGAAHVILFDYMHVWAVAPPPRKVSHMGQDPDLQIL